MEKSEPIKKRFSLSKVFLRKSFLERTSLLIITAITSGIMIPEISYRMQSQNQKQEIVLAKQAELLDDLTITILTYESLALDVTWYVSNEEVYNNEMHLKAYQRYAERLPDLLVRLRAGLLKASYLASPGVSKKLAAFQQKIFGDQDTPISVLMNKKDATVAQWAELHNTNTIIASEAMSLLEELAEDFKLTKEYALK